MCTMIPQTSDTSGYSIHPFGYQYDVGRSSYELTRKEYNPDDDHHSLTVIEILLLLFSYALLVLFFPIALLFVFRTVNDYEMLVYLRFGRRRQDLSERTGVVFYLPCTDHLLTVDSRVSVTSMYNQEVLTKEAITLMIDIVFTYRVTNPFKAALRIQDYRVSTKQIATAITRNVVSRYEFASIFTRKTEIAGHVLSEVANIINKWGVIIETIEIKDVRLPRSLARAMASEGAAKQLAKSKIIAADADLNAAEDIHEAAVIMSRSPGSLQLRLYQTLETIASEACKIIIVPVPQKFYFNLNKSEYLKDTRHNH